MQEYAAAPERARREARRETAARPPKRRIRYTNKVRVALCYFLAWSLALAIPAAGLVWVYPNQAAGMAPSVAEHAARVFPAAFPWLESAIRAATVTEGLRQDALTDVLAARDLHWTLAVGGVNALLWLVTLALQLVWRSRYRRPLFAAKAARRALRGYRFTLFGAALFNALGALFLYLLGLRFIGRPTLWDWLLTMNGFGLNVLAAFACFRLGAPPAISGRHGFFRRL